MLVRNNVWSVNTWTPELTWYATAVAAMKLLPLNDPLGWEYQGAIHGKRDELPTPGKPWSTCQHRTWFFLPWHRMFLLYFERIVRYHVKQAGGPEDWTLPYWDWGNPAQRVLPRAFREPTRPDNTPNPLYVPNRRLNGGAALPPDVTSSADAMAKTVYTSSWWRTGFGGEETGFHHGGGTAGALEDQPHDVVHVRIGGIMGNTNTAALDPIFWLHHANIDRLWETWRRGLHADPYPQEQSFRGQKFQFKNTSRNDVEVPVGQVLDMLKLGYRYDTLPEPHEPGEPSEEAVVASGTGGDATEPAMVGRSADSMVVTRQGGEVEVPIGPPPPRASTALGEPAWYLELADIVGPVNPGVVYGVHVLPPGGGRQDAHRVGLVSFFGIELTDGSAHPLRYMFEFTEALQQLAPNGTVDEVEVALWPLPDDGSDETDQLDDEEPTVTVGTVAVFVG